MFSEDEDSFSIPSSGESKDENHTKDQSNLNSYQNNTKSKWRLSTEIARPSQYKTSILVWFFMFFYFVFG